MTRALYDVGKAHSGRVEDLFDMRKSEPSLVFNRAADDLSCRHIQRSLADDVQPSVDKHASRVGARRNSFLRMAHLRFGHLREPQLFFARREWSPERCSEILTLRPIRVAR